MSANGNHQAANHQAASHEAANHGADIQSDVQRSSRDLAALRVDFEQWLAGRLPGDAAPTIPELRGTSANGMSSETLLFEATWHEDGAPRHESLVARVAPDAADFPVFPAYDLRKQFEIIRLVGERTSVPVPRVWWLEEDPSVIGAPFFTMSQVDGVVPPDVLPYNFGESWLFDASPAEQQRLQDTTVATIATLHTVTADDPEVSFLEFAEAGDTRLRRHVAHARAWYEFAARDAGRSPLVERGFAWLDEHWPAPSGADVVSWGDSRIGNVLYRDFEPVAVLDWEMVGLGPPELDLGWLIYAHRVFEDIAAQYGFPGMPDFLVRDAVLATYEQVSGREPRDVDWYVTYAAVQWGVVGMRTGRRAVHFGERDMPDDVDELVMNREGLEQLLAGTYWD